MWIEWWHAQMFDTFTCIQLIFPNNIYAMNMNKLCCADIHSIDKVKWNKNNLLQWNSSCTLSKIFTCVCNYDLKTTTLLRCESMEDDFIIICSILTVFVFESRDILLYVYQPIPTVFVVSYDCFLHSLNCEESIIKSVNRLVYLIDSSWVG